MKKNIQNFWGKIRKNKGSPKNIALGFAIGSFIAILPTFGFSILFGMFILFLYPRLNKIAVFTALAIWNPLTQIPIYAIAYSIGSVLFGDLPVVRYKLEILNQVFTFSRRLLVGEFILALLISMTSYYALFYFLNKKT